MLSLKGIVSDKLNGIEVNNSYLSNTFFYYEIWWVQNKNRCWHVKLILILLTVILSQNSMFCSSFDAVSFKVQAFGAIRAPGWRTSCCGAPRRLGFHGPQHSVALVLCVCQVETRSRVALRPHHLQSIWLNKARPLIVLACFCSLVGSVTALSFFIMNHDFVITSHFRGNSYPNPLSLYPASKWAGAQGCWWSPTGLAGSYSGGIQAEFSAAHRPSSVQGILLNNDWFAGAWASKAVPCPSLGSCQRNCCYPLYAARCSFAPAMSLPACEGDSEPWGLFLAVTVAPFGTWNLIYWCRKLSCFMWNRREP